MANLTVDQLSNVVQTGQIEKLFTGTASTTASEKLATTEMAHQGLAPSAPDMSGKNFSDILRDSVDKVNLYQTQADTAIKELIAGRSKNIHETMLAVERADASLKMLMQVRNKVLDAYKEIMRMQV